MDEKREERENDLRNPEGQKRDQDMPMEEHPKEGWDEEEKIGEEPMEEPHQEDNEKDEDMSHGMK